MTYAHVPFLLATSCMIKINVNRLEVEGGLMIKDLGSKGLFFYFFEISCCFFFLNLRLSYVIVYIMIIGDFYNR
jgi:hypothetical protein